MSGVSQDFTVNGQAALVVSPSGNAIAGGKLANVTSSGNPTSDALANALAQDARNGLLMIPTINGAPTAAPQEYVPGAVPIVFDVTSNTFFAYVGNAWLQSAPATTSNAITVYTDPQTPSPTPSPTPGGPSADGSTLTSTSGTIVDSAGNVWALNYYPLPTPVPAPTPSPSPVPSPSPSPSPVPLPTPSPSPGPSPSPTPSPAPSGAVPNYKGRMNLIGVNISGAEYGTPGTGTVGTDYTYPSPSEVSYFASKGCNVIRVPFNLERLQPTQNGALSGTELGYIQQVVSSAASNNVVVVLDPHNYGSAWGNLIGSSGTPVSSFANFWGAVAQAFNNAPNVMFGLMNEPNQQTASGWAQANVAAIGAIRQTGAANQIMVPGTSWTGAWTWVSSGNADAINPTTMADSNIAFEVHQYLDSDGSGTNYGPITDPQIGVSRLTAATQWAQSVGATLFLGEVGVPSDSQSLTALQNMVSYMEQNSSVWQGLAYWAAGQWLGTYALSIEPSNGQDTVQMGVLDQFVPGGALATGYAAPGG